MYTLTLILFALLMLTAALSDLYKFRISNAVVLGVFLLYPIHVLAAPDAQPWLESSLLMLASLACAVLAFNAGLMGAGDGKLISGLLLWSGTAMALDVLIITGLAGLGLTLLFGTRLRFAVAMVMDSSVQYAESHLSNGRIPVTDATAEQSTAQQLVQGLTQSLLAHKLPYGMAIASGGLFLVFVRVGLLQPLG